MKFNKNYYIRGIMTITLQRLKGRSQKYTDSTMVV